MTRATLLRQPTEADMDLAFASLAAGGSRITAASLRDAALAFEFTWSAEELHEMLRLASDGGAVKRAQLQRLVEDVKVRVPL